MLYHTVLQERLEAESSMATVTDSSGVVVIDLFARISFSIRLACTGSIDPADWGSESSASVGSARDELKERLAELFEEVAPERRELHN